MSEKELNSEIEKLVKLGLLEKRTTDGKTEIRITSLGKKYAELNLLQDEEEE